MVHVAGVVVLVERLLLSGSSSLVWLDLALNDINDGGARALLRVIEDDSSPLEYLDLKVSLFPLRRRPTGNMLPRICFPALFDAQKGMSSPWCHQAWFD